MKTILSNDVDDDDNEGNCFLSQGTPGAVVGQLMKPLGSEPVPLATPKVEVEDVDARPFPSRAPLGKEAEVGGTTGHL